MLDLVVVNETQLVKTIKAHLAKAEMYKGKAEEHYITAGQHLMTLKGNSPDQATFLQIVKEQIGLGKSRAYELLQIADGTKTVEGIRAADAEKHKRQRAESCPGRPGQTKDHDTPVFDSDTTERHVSPPAGPSPLAITDGQQTHQSPQAAHGRNAQTAVAEDEGEGDSEETCWRRGLLYRSTNAAGEALYEDWSQFTVDPELVAAATRAAEAWNKLAAYLKELHNEQIRTTNT